VFALQKLLDVREWEEKQAEHTLAAKTGQCAACEADIRALLERRHAVFLTRAGLDLNVLAAHDAFRAKAGRDIESKQKELARLTVEREDLLKVYLEKRRRRDVLSKLSQRQETVFRAAQAKREALNLDDLNTGAFIRKMGAEEVELGES
jgi:flagellar export protein FliJ